MKALFDLQKNEMIDFPFLGEYTNEDPNIILVDVIPYDKSTIPQDKKMTESIWSIQNGNQYVESITIEDKTPSDYDEEIALQTPSEVQLWRLRTILKAQGLFTSVQTAIANIQDTNLRLAAEEGFEYGNFVSRTSPVILAVQSALGLTDRQVNELFIAAEQIDA